MKCNFMLLFFSGPTSCWSRPVFCAPQFTAEVAPPLPLQSAPSGPHQLSFILIFTSWSVLSSVLTECSVPSLLNVIFTSCWIWSSLPISIFYILINLILTFCGIWSSLSTEFDLHILLNLIALSTETGLIPPSNNFICVFFPAPPLPQSHLPSFYRQTETKILPESSAATAFSDTTIYSDCRPTGGTQIGCT